MGKKTLRTKRAGAKGDFRVLTPLPSGVSLSKWFAGKYRFTKKTGGKRTRAYGKHARKGARSVRKRKRACRKLRGGRQWSSYPERQKGGTPSPEKASPRRASSLENNQTKRSKPGFSFKLPTAAPKPKPRLSFALPAQTAADEDAAAAEVQAGAADELSGANIDELFAKAAQLSSEDQHAMERALMRAN